jgi:hypothetical protein
MRFGLPKLYLLSQCQNCSYTGLKALRRNKVKTFKVLMLAFGEPGTIRFVDLEDDSVDLENVSAVLEAVFMYGQNDFQPKQCQSVSCGDVIEFKATKYLVCRFGFRSLTEQEFNDHVALPRLQRSFNPLLDNPNV